jgi:uncharacterized membrane protein
VEFSGVFYSVEFTADGSTEGANPFWAFSDPHDGFAHISMSSAQIEMRPSYIIQGNSRAITANDSTEGANGKFPFWAFFDPRERVVRRALSFAQNNLRHS